MFLLCVKKFYFVVDNDFRLTLISLISLPLVLYNMLYLIILFLGHCYLDFTGIIWMNFDFQLLNLWENHGYLKKDILEVFVVLPFLPVFICIFIYFFFLLKSYLYFVNCIVFICMFMQFK